MITPAINERVIKKAMKSALVEVLDERRDLFLEIFAEALEDIALTRAIKEGERTGLVSRETVFSILKSSK